MQSDWTMQVRAAEAGDAPGIAAIWTPVITDTAITFNAVPHGPDALVEMIATRPVFLVAESAGQVVGFACAVQFRSGVGYRETFEHTVLLAPMARGRGVGRMLMAALEARVRGLGGHSLWAGVSAENPAGVAFHAAIGFRKVAVLPEVGIKFGRRMDLVLMVKKLGAGQSSS